LFAGAAIGLALFEFTVASLLRSFLLVLEASLLYGVAKLFAQAFFGVVLAELFDPAVGGGFVLLFSFLRFGLLLTSEFGFLFVGEFLFLEVVILPDFFAEESIGGVARVEDHVMMARIEVGHAKIGAGGLERIKKEAGSFGLDLPGDEQAHDLHERDLDGVGVFENGQDEAGSAAADAVSVQVNAFVLKAFVKKQKRLRRSAGDPHWVPLIFRC
jgi:hypothetical protein